MLCGLMNVPVYPPHPGVVDLEVDVDKPAFAVDAACVDTVEAIDTWDGTERHIAKDRIDGLRYALVEEWAGRARGFVAGRVRIQ